MLLRKGKKPDCGELHETKAERTCCAQTHACMVDDCPCTQTRCHRHGNCVECIRVHRTRQQHIPECLQGMFRGLVKDLAALVEYDVRDLRRTPAFWDERLGNERLGKKAPPLPAGKGESRRRNHRENERRQNGSSRSGQETKRDPEGYRVSRRRRDQEGRGFDFP